MKILSRYLLVEMVVPLVAWAGFLFLLLFVMALLRGTEVLLGSAVTASDMGRFALYLAPHFLQQALPVAFLLAVLLSLGRLSEDGELTAMHSLGVGPAQLLRAPVVLAMILGGAMVGMAFTIEPWGLRAVKEAANEVIKRNLAGDVRSGVFYTELSNLTLYAGEVHPAERKWSRVLVHDARDPSSPLLILAKEAEVNPSGQGEELRLSLVDGGLHREDASREKYQLLAFERGDLWLGVGEAFHHKNHFKRPKEELTPAELLQAARQAYAAGEDGRPFLSACHWRFGQALMPLAFALLGTPLAMGRRQGGRARGYLLTIAGYVAYYVLARVCMNLAERERLPLLLGGQLPNLVFAALGLWALRRVLRAGNAR